MSNSLATTRKATISQPTQLDPANCPAYVLAGGQSSRFGSDKALVQINGEILLLRVIRILESNGHAVSVVADRRNRYQAFGVQCLVDAVAGIGPLGGLATALAHRQEQGPGWILLISCDQVTWSELWFRQLAGAAGAEQDVITFVDAQDAFPPIIQPIPGLYHTRLLPSVRACLDGQQRSLKQLIQNCNAAGIQCEDNPRDWSFNTVQELHGLQMQLL